MSKEVASRLKSIDFLRGIAALSVVVYAGFNYLNYVNFTSLQTDPLGKSLWFQVLYAIVSQGYLGVPLFFVISGFCIHLPWARQVARSGDAGVSFVSFWKRRWFRLYPTYFVVLCLSMALVVLAYVVARNMSIIQNYPHPVPRWIAIDFVAHATMLHGLHPALDKAGGNAPFWSLAREEYLYLMYFALLACRKAFGIASGLGMVLATSFLFPLLMLPIVPHGSPWWMIVDTSALVLWTQWTLGMLAVEAHYGLVKIPAWCSWIWLVPVWGAAALIGKHFYVPLGTLFWGFAFFTLVNYCVARERSGLWPDRSIVAWLTGVGVFSYSLYLIHIPVRVVVRQLLGPFAATTNPFIYVVISALMIVASYFAAKLLFELVERHFLFAKHRGAVQATPAVAQPVSSYIKAS